MESEHPYYEDEDYGGRVLWGRIAFFGVALLLMFVLGRCTAGGGVPPERLELAQQDKQELQAQVEELKGQLEKARSQSDDSGDSQDGGNGQDGSGSDGDANSPNTGGSDGGDGSQNGSGSGETRTHVVEPGDTLSELAERYYGDGDKADVIAEANDIGEDEYLQVGQELTIPPDPES